MLVHRIVNNDADAALAVSITSITGVFMFILFKVDGIAYCGYAITWKTNQQKDYFIFEQHLINKKSRLFPDSCYLFAA